MTAWNYLRFDKHGELMRGCPLPADGEFVWGFCGEDHRVYLCFKEPGYGISFVDPISGIDDDLWLIAWAPIASPQAPDFAEFRRAGTLKPPIVSLEAARLRVVERRRRHRKLGPAKSKAEQRRREHTIATAKSIVADIAADCVLEDGFHLPRGYKSLRRYAHAIPTSPPKLNG